MQLTQTTDYAVKALMYFACEGRVVSAEEVSDKMKIPKQYFLTMAKSLKNAGLIAAKGGKNGGYLLAKSAENITLLDIISVTEESMKLCRCLKPSASCERFALSECPLRQVYSGLQNKLEEHLSGVTLAELSCCLEEPGQTLRSIAV